MYTLVLVSLMSVVVEMIKPNVHPGFGVADFRGYNIDSSGSPYRLCLMLVLQVRI